MSATSRYRRAAIGLSLFLAACTTTVTKTKNPEFVISMDSVGRQIDGLVTSQHVNLDGKEITTNGKDGSALEIDIINGQNIPEVDKQMNMLGRSIAADIHNALKDKNEYKAFLVLFVKIDSGTVVLKRTWKGFEYPAAEF